MEVIVALRGSAVVSVRLLCSSEEWEDVLAEEKRRLDQCAEDGEFWWVEPEPVKVSAAAAH